MTVEHKYDLKQISIMLSKSQLRNPMKQVFWIIAKEIL